MKWSEVDMKLKIIIYLITIASFVTGGATGFYKTFAKEKAFQAHITMYLNDKEEAKKKELRQIIYECKTRYGAEYEKSPDKFTTDFCIDAEIDLENLTEE
jgi:capsular polysaccharide biosynthesis protein